MTKTLTDKWREGTIDWGLYYVKVIGRSDITIADANLDEELNVEEVLDPVPSYEDYNDLKEDNKYLKSGIETRDNQIEQLKKNLEVSEKAHYKTLEQLRIATKALEEFKKKEDTYLDFGLTSDWKEVKLNPNRVATKALKEMEGVK